MAQVATRAAVVPAVVKMHTWLYVSSMCVDFSQCHLGKEGSRPFAYHKHLLGVFRSQPSPCSAHETQKPAPALVRLRHEISSLAFAFALLQRMKPLFWPFGHIQCEMQVGLFMLYPTSLSCHST
jgi:hypothetical protein